MPKNQRESLIFTVPMCFIMVLWMSNYNVALFMGGVSIASVKEAWLGLPLAFCYAIICDWFVASKLVKGIAFRYILKPVSPDWMKSAVISTGMVVVMCTLMSLYGAAEACVHTGQWKQIFFVWITKIPVNATMAWPFQIIVAGPVLRKLFRYFFPEGSILA